MVNELPHVDWIKEETFPPGHAITAELRLCGPKLKGIMGGVAGRYLMDEYERGACGNMPACEMTDVHSAVWNLLDAGKKREARAMFNRLLPVLNYEAVVPGVYKAILKRRGHHRVGLPPRLPRQPARRERPQGADRHLRGYEGSVQARAARRGLGAPRDRTGLGDPAPYRLPMGARFRTCG